MKYAVYLTGKARNIFILDIQINHSEFDFLTKGAKDPNYRVMMKRINRDLVFYIDPSGPVTLRKELFKSGPGWRCTMRYRPDFGFVPATTAVTTIESVYRDPCAKNAKGDPTPPQLRFAIDQLCPADRRLPIQRLIEPLYNPEVNPPSDVRHVAFRPITPTPHHPDNDLKTALEMLNSELQHHPGATPYIRHDGRVGIKIMTEL